MAGARREHGRPRSRAVLLTNVQVTQIFVLQRQFAQILYSNIRFGACLLGQIFLSYHTSEKMQLILKIKTNTMSTNRKIQNQCERNCFIVQYWIQIIY